MPLRKQVAGNGTRGKGEFGFLQRQDNRLLKEANPKELNFDLNDYIKFQDPPYFKD